MKLSEAKVGMYICKLGSTSYRQITKVNAKSITYDQWYNLKEKDLEDYVILDKAWLKCDTIKRYIRNELSGVNNLIDKLSRLVHITESYQDYFKLDTDKIKSEINEMITHLKNSIDAIAEEASKNE